jgi:hypothetical protein
VGGLRSFPQEESAALRRHPSWALKVCHADPRGLTTSKAAPRLSRKQMYILDGIRYSAEMAHIAYERLATLLQMIAASRTEPTTRDIATAMLDAWSIVDAAHRFRDLVAQLPGLSHSTWTRLLEARTADVAELRNCVQHQIGEIAGLIQGGGQIWGYLSWTEVREGQYTGKWLMLTAGSDYVGDRWLFVGPASLPFEVPPGRIRLNAFERQVYLGRTVGALVEATRGLEDEISRGAVRPVGDAAAADRRGADVVYEGWIEVLYSVRPSEGGQLGTAPLAASQPE